MHVQIAIDGFGLKPGDEVYLRQTLLFAATVEVYRLYCN